MKRYLFYSVLIVLVLIVIFFLQDSDEFSWLRAKLGDKSTDYAQYMLTNPDGWHTLEAQKRFDQRCWTEALQGKTLAHFQNYLDQNPDGFYVDAANQRILVFIWEQVKSKNTIADYEQFTKNYPESEYIDLAKKNIEKLQWQKVSSGRDIEQYKEFIKKYPDSEIITQAQNVFEDMLWTEAISQKQIDKIKEYIQLFPKGRHIVEAQKMLTVQEQALPIYIDSFHLYDLTVHDKDYGYIFEKQIKDILSKFETIKIVSEKADALVHLEIGYALSYRDGQAGDDNVSKFFQNRWRDKAIIKQLCTLATYDIALQLYLWDIENDCLLAYSFSETPPEPGNAMVARTTGRDKFLDEQVAMHLNNSFVKFLENLKKGKDDVMNLSGNNPTLFFRHDIGKPKRLINVNFKNGPISVYHWRDPTIERYIYYQLQQSDMDIVRTFDNQSYQLEVIWSKYPRQQQLNLNSPLREYGLSADFRILEKDKEQEDKLVFEKTILSEILPGEIYGIQPIEVIAQWRKIFDNSYIVGDIVRRLQSPPINFDLDKTSESDNW